MKTMPPTTFAQIAILGLLVLSATPVQGEEGKPAAFEVTVGNRQLFVTTPASGGLGTFGTTISPREIFQVVDLNGHELKDGDKVKIFYEESVWSEDEGLVRRVPKRDAKDEKTVFTVVKDGTKYKLKAPSGDFVGSQKTDEQSLATLATTKEKHEALEIKIHWEPTPGETEEGTVKP